MLGVRYLDHKVITEAPTRLGTLLPQCAHVILKATQVLGEGHEKQSAQLSQE